MSLDLYVHCKSAMRLTTEQLSAALAADGIGSAIFEDSVKYKPADVGPITSCTILGWLPSQFDSAHLTELLNAGDKRRLHQLFAKDIVGYANVYSYDAAEHYATFGDDYLDSLSGEVDQQFVAFLKSSKRVFEIQTSSGRSDFSWRFQMQVCRTIAELSNGLIEEPQMGEYFFPEMAGDYLRRLAE